VKSEERKEKAAVGTIWRKKEGIKPRMKE